MLKDKIKEYRLLNQMTQLKLAEELGLTRQAVTRWENGDVEPSTENLIALSRIFNCKVDDLINNQEVTKNSFWSLTKENTFLIILSSLIFLFYLFQKGIWDYSMTLFLAIEIPLFLFSTIFTAILNPIVKSKEGFIALIKTPLIIIAVHALFGLLTEL